MVILAIFNAIFGGESPNFFQASLAKLTKVDMKKSSKNS